MFQNRIARFENRIAAPPHPPLPNSHQMTMRALASTSSSLASCSGNRQMTTGASRAAQPPLPLLSFGGAAASRRCRRLCRSDLLRPLFALSPRSDEVLRTLSEASEISILAVDGTRLVAEATTRHGTAPTASAALGRALLGGLLMSAFKGEGEATQITFKGTGPLGGLQVVAEATGAVKGRVDNPSADPPLRKDGKLDVGGAVGGGVLAIVRSREGGGEAYTGLTQIVSGEIADDLAHYLATSEQVRGSRRGFWKVGRAAGEREREREREREPRPRGKVSSHTQQKKNRKKNTLLGQLRPRPRGLTRQVGPGASCRRLPRPGSSSLLRGDPRGP